ncbi:hypothetical protein J437_LFUL004591 [Ladona fulva]|uniref:Uncharacterized protein n=1 Tax=Ladona fulva TaxID=123851 RepID=A0A8K0JZ78_LADFU|nr:hypothetical protein J437_LFUL004591 [Ladona fulva]
MADGAPGTISGDLGGEGIGRATSRRDAGRRRGSNPGVGRGVRRNPPEGGANPGRKQRSRNRGHVAGQQRPQPQGDSRTSPSQSPDEPKGLPPRIVESPKEGAPPKVEVRRSEPEDSPAKPPRPDSLPEPLPQLLKSPVESTQEPRRRPRAVRFSPIGSPGDDAEFGRRVAGDGESTSPEVPPEDLDPETEELARLRCPSESAEVVAERELRRRGRRRCADYPGLAFGSSIFSSDTMMKFSIIRNELHNIMNTQLKRVRNWVSIADVVFSLSSFKRFISVPENPSLPTPDQLFCCSVQVSGCFARLPVTIVQFCVAPGVT